MPAAGPGWHRPPEPLPIPLPHLGVLLALAAPDPLRKSSDFSAAGALQGEIGHGDRPLVVGDHHPNEVGIGCANAHVWRSALEGWSRLGSGSVWGGVVGTGGQGCGQPTPETSSSVRSKTMHGPSPVRCCPVPSWEGLIPAYAGH